MKKQKKLTYHLVSLGCPKNQVDSDGIEMLLRGAAYGPTDSADKADVLIVNTCGFLAAAKEESIAVLSDLGKQKRAEQVLVAAGCLAQRDGAEVLARVPQVDGLLGTRRWMEVLELVHQIRNRSGRSLQQYALLGEESGRAKSRGVVSLLGDPATDYDRAVPRPPVAGGSAYLKISDGCNAPCAFCTIPSFKGKLRSRPLAAVVDEALALVHAGAKELVVVAQDTTDYGRDWGEPNSLPRLLSAICQRTDGDLRWVRLMYAYPGHVSDELIEVMAREEKIVPYLDMPLQHGDPRTLRRMRRPSRLEMVYDHVEKLRQVMPDIALRSTFIVGYPGESAAEFQGLLDFVEAIEFDKVGAFQFSPEPDTPAALLPDPVDEAVKEERYGQLMELQQSISLHKNQEQVGKRLEILVEGEGEIAESGVPLLLGRSYRDAPEVDGLVLVPGLAGVPAGAMVEVTVTGAMEYDLVGEPLIEEVFHSSKASITLGESAFGLPSDERERPIR